MNSFTVIFFFVQACLVQNVFSQCMGRAGIAPAAALAPFGAGIAPGAYGMVRDALGLAPYGYGAEVAAFDGVGIGPSAYGMYRDALGLAPYGYGAEVAAIDGIAQYGGAGEGNVAVAGELPVAGTTAVAGQVPIMGAVRFGGDVGAFGAVTITGQCSCVPVIPLENFY